MNSLTTAVDSLVVASADMASKQSQQCGQKMATLNGLPLVAVRCVVKFLPLPDLCNLKQVNKKFHTMIGDSEINEAKQRCLLEFKHLKKVSSCMSCCQYQGKIRQYQIGSDGKATCETITDPLIKTLRGAFTPFRYIPRNESVCRLTSYGLSDTASIHLGQLENGLYFVMALNPDMVGNFFRFFPKYQTILYAGERTPAYTGESAHSMYCGHSYEAAIGTFELACQGQDLAGHIRELLGLQKVYY